MSKKYKRYDSFVAKLGVGFDSVLDTIDQVDSTANYDDLAAIPPFNIKKTTDKDYAVELSLPGVAKEDISAKIDEEFLIVSGTVAKPADPEGDDQYFHKGIFQGGKFEAKFTIAKNLQFKAADLTNGVLTVWFYDSNVKRTLTTIAIGPFPTEEKYEVQYNSAGSPIMVPVGESVETSVNAIPLVPAVVVNTDPVAEDTTSTVVNTESTSVPTTEVVLPDPLPQIVEVSIDPTGTSTTSTAPQAVITVEEATHEVSDNTSVEVIKTPEGQPDIVVSLPDVVKEIAEKNGIDIIADITKAIEVSQPEISLPDVVPETTISEESIIVNNPVNDKPKVEVTVPDTLAPVVELVKTEESTSEVPAVTLTPIDATDIPEDHILVPVVTQEGQNDVIVAVDPVLHEELVKSGVDISTDVSAAVIEASAEVTSVSETVTEVVNINDQTTPTVEVTLPVELPQIVEVKVDEVPAVVDNVSAAPQVTVTVTDATAELPDNVTTSVVSTEEGKSDVIVAIDSETHAELLDKGVDVLEAVKEAISQSNEVVAPDLPPSTEEVATTDVVVTPTDLVSVEPVTITLPDVIPQVMEATVTEDNSVILTDSSNSVPEGSTVTPVITQEGQPDVVIVTTPETDAKLEEMGVNITKDISTAIIAAEPEVIVTSSTPEEVVEAAAVDTTVVTTDADNTKTPTVAVTLPTEMPQIVEVSLDEVATKVDVKSEEPQASVTLTDAIYEVSDNVTLETVKTPDGSADIVVAIPNDIQATLDAKKIDIMPAIEAAINSSEVTLPEVPVSDAEVKDNVEVPVVEAEALKPETAVSISVPETVTPVMEATVSTSDSLGTIVELVPADATIPTDAILIPVVTPEGQNDIVVAVSDEVKTTIEASGDTAANILTDAVKQADVTVVDPGVIDTTEVTPL